MPESAEALPTSLALSADARNVAFVRSSAPDRVRLVDLTTGVARDLDAPPSPGAPVDAVAFADSGQRVLYSTARGDVQSNPGAVCRAPGDDCNGLSDVYRHDRLTNRTRRTSLTCFDEESVGACGEFAPSGTGGRVAMVCSGDDLVLSDENDQLDVFLRDEGSRWTFAVSLSSWGAQANGPSGAMALDGFESPGLAVSVEGTRIAFVSAADNLVSDDDNGVVDVFVHDLLPGITERVSVGTGGNELNATSGRTGIGLSGDGRFVVFESDATNVVVEVLSPGPHVYLHDRSTGETRRLSREREGCTAPGASTHPAVSRDGRVVTFVSTHPCLDVDDLGDAPADAPHLYVWRGLYDTLHLVDRSLGGGPSEAPVLAYELAANGAWALLQSAATDLVEEAPGAGAWLYLAPTVEDRDEDGLEDPWERDGLDLDRDGLVDLDLPALGASPARRDLFVEYDYLVSTAFDHALSATATEWLETAFAEAPLENPDGSTGITLHLDAEGADAIPLVASTNRVSLAELSQLRATWGGTAADRADPNAASRLAARRVVFRYGLLGHLLEGSDSSGLAELPGDEFLVTLGAFADGVGTLEQQAGTFLHELGHTLALHHGGVDAINCKPNYLSVMSYTFQFPDLLPGRPLDYSRDRLLELNENELDEALGIGGPAGWTTVFGPGTFDLINGFQPWLAPADGPIDWNADGDATDANARGDINDLSYFCPSLLGERLTGFDDWTHLVYNARGAVDFEEGLHIGVQPAELTAEDLVALREFSPFGDNAVPFAVIEPLGPVREGEVVVLDGLASFDPEGASLRARWARLTGPSVVFADRDALRTELIAPEVDRDRTLKLELAVWDGVFWSAPAFTTLTVVDDDRAGGVVRPGGSDVAANERPLGTPILDSVDAAEGGGAALELPDVRGAGELPEVARDATSGCACGAVGTGAEGSWVVVCAGLWLVSWRRRRARRR